MRDAIRFEPSRNFLAFSLRVCPMLVMSNNHYCKVFPFVTTEIEMFPDGLLESFGLSGRIFCGGHLSTQRIAQT